MNEFILFIEDSLKPFGTIKTKKMFGCTAIYLNSKIIGIVEAGEFYIKANNNSVLGYQKNGLKQFSYKKGEKLFYLKYFIIADEILEDTHLLKQYILNCY